MNLQPLTLHPPACHQLDYITENAVCGDSHAIRPYLFPGRRDLRVHPDGSVELINPRPVPEGPPQ